MILVSYGTSDCNYSVAKVANRRIDMNFKALITTFVLGSSAARPSSVAMAHLVAAPVTVRPVAQPVAEPLHRAPMPAPYELTYQLGYRRSSWVTLGGVNHIVDGQMSFRLGRMGLASERFSTLQLQSQAGKSLIQRVLIQFGNGRTQVVEVNQYLNASNPTITIDLDGRARTISKVTVIGRNARHGVQRARGLKRARRRGHGTCSIEAVDGREHRPIGRIRFFAGRVTEV